MAESAVTRSLEVCACNTQIVAGPQGTFYLRRVKRVIDFLFAVAGLMLTFPLVLVCAVAVRIDSQGPVFFRQTRVGRQGRPFEILKLRTMVEKADQKGPKLTASDDSRVTWVGKWLRKTKIDEIPQLVNILRGEMSLVGPRPEVPEYVAFYSQYQRRVLELRPGLTGRASLAFIDEEEILAGHPNREDVYVKTLMGRKLELDLIYCDRVSFLEDAKLVVLTLGNLLNLGHRRKVSRT